MKFWTIFTKCFVNSTYTWVTNYDVQIHVFHLALLQCVVLNTYFFFVNFGQFLTKNYLIRLLRGSNYTRVYTVTDSNSNKNFVFVSFIKCKSKVPVMSINITTTFWDFFFVDGKEKRRKGKKFHGNNIFFSLYFHTFPVLLFLLPLFSISPFTFLNLSFALPRFGVVHKWRHGPRGEGVSKDFVTTVLKP